MSFPVHISCTSNEPRLLRANPLILTKSKVFVAVLFAVLMTKTCVPLLERPEKYSGVLVVGAEGVGLNGAAGVPMSVSWWKARSSLFLMISN